MEDRKGKWSPEAGGAEAVKIYLARPCYINIGDFSDEDKSCAGSQPFEGSGILKQLVSNC